MLQSSYNQNLKCSNCGKLFVETSDGVFTSQCDSRCCLIELPPYEPVTVTVSGEAEK